MLTQEFFVVLSVLDIVGSTSIMSSAQMLFVINMDDEVVEFTLKLMGSILYVFAGYAIVDGMYKSINAFDTRQLPSLADLLVDWLVDMSESACSHSNFICWWH
jgi:hypothetical protein